MEKIVQSLKVTEIFYSLQGEGSRSGEPSIFIRLQGCSAHNACFKSGIDCDTEFISGSEMNLDQIYKELQKYKGSWIIWTGGEPMDQLDENILKYFKDRGYNQALETSGIRKPCVGFDYISLSPKVAEHVILKKWGDQYIDEVRWVRSKGQMIPDTKIKADFYYISPHSSGGELNKDNMLWCIELIKENPKWRLSIQQHKIWNVR